VVHVDQVENHWSKWTGTKEYSQFAEKEQIVTEVVSTSTKTFLYNNVPPLHWGARQNSFSIECIQGSAGFTVDKGPGPRAPPPCSYVCPYVQHVRATSSFLSRKVCLSVGQTAVFRLNII